MPSLSHELLVELFRERPALGLWRLGHVLGPDAPLPAGARIHASEIRDLAPADYRADAVLCLVDEQGTTVESIIIEVQLDIDPQKRVSWPLYLAGARLRFGASATLLVIALDERVARYCAEPLILDRNGSKVCPLVIGPQTIPVLVDEAQAQALPELALLSIAAHHLHERASEIALAALSGLDAMDGVAPDHVSLYADFIYSLLGPVAQAAMEKLMSLRNYTYQSDKFIKTHQQGVEQGRKEGLEQGLEQGRRDVLLRLLARRFGDLPDDARARLAQAGIPELDMWAERVLDARSIAEVFAEPAAG